MDSREDLVNFAASFLTKKILIWLASRWAFFGYGPVAYVVGFFAERFLREFIKERGIDVAVYLTKIATDKEVKTIEDLVGREDVNDDELMDAYRNLIEFGKL